jgi:hypothetical protein
MAKQNVTPATATGAENSLGTASQALETNSPCNQQNLWGAVSLTESIRTLGKGRNFFQPEEIKTAKRKLSLAQMMKRLGDGAFISEQSTASPFHPSERQNFKLYRMRRGFRFTCCGKCGYEGDQIDYLKARFQLTTGKAIALFCRLAGIS